MCAHCREMQVLRLAVMVCPMLVSSLAGGSAAAARLWRYLHLLEWQPCQRCTQQEVRNGTAQLSLQAASLKWDRPPDDALPLVQDDPVDWSGDGETPRDGQTPMPGSLRQVSLDIPAHRLTCIAGAVDAGESTLLQALLGEVSLDAGAMQLATANGVAPFVAYCAQDAWLPFVTIRDAITFDSPWQPALYKQVVHACALLDGLAVLPAGDGTHVGERGITLSGGQRARVALARAVYAAVTLSRGHVPTGVDATATAVGPPIVLLDGVLSAVDPHVSSHIFGHAVQGLLRCAGATVVFATHGQQFLQYTDHVVVLAQGSVLAQGTLAQLAQAQLSTPEQQAVLQSAIGQALESRENVAGTVVVPAAIDVTVESAEAEASPVGMNAADAHVVTMEAMTASHDADTLPAEAMDAGVEQDKGSHADRATQVGTAAGRVGGAVAWSVCLGYLRVMAPALPALLAVAHALQDGGQVAADWWQSRWSVDAYHESAMWYAGVYMGVALAGVAMMAGYQLNWAAAGIRSAAKLHDVLLQGVAGSPMSFFNTTPTGRITNRFSGELELVDKQLPLTMAQAASIIGTVIATVVVRVAVMPWVLLALVPLALLCLRAQHMYQACGRDMQRLEGIVRSPQCSLLHESLTGLATVQAFGVQRRIAADNARYTHAYAAAVWQCNCLNRRLGVRLDIMGATGCGCSWISCGGHGRHH